MSAPPRRSLWSFKWGVRDERDRHRQRDDGHGSHLRSDRRQQQRDADNHDNGHAGDMHNSTATRARRTSASSGLCQHPPMPEFTSCGDPSAAVCNAADSCNATGGCVDRKKAGGTVCLAGTGICDPDDVCDGTTNACTVIHSAEGTLCGDPDTTLCNAADSCDAAGVCVDRKKAAGTVCLAGTESVTRTTCAMGRRMPAP